MGRTDEKAVATGAPEAAAAAAGEQQTMEKEEAAAGERGLPPGPAPSPQREDARLAERRARLDAACATVFRTKLLRQFAALMYKNR